MDIVERLRDRGCVPLYEANMRDEAADEIERLRELLRDAPILLVDRNVAKFFDEKVCLEYADAVAAWHKKAADALEQSPPPKP